MTSVQMTSKESLGKGVSHPEAILRMNFLVQAAAISKGLVEGVAGTELSRTYVKTMKDVSQKLVIRMYHQHYYFCTINIFEGRPR